MVFVIAGGPGFGKSVLIEKLHELGYQVGSEIAREIISQQISEGGGFLPWKDIAEFEKRVIEKRVEFIKSVDINSTAFSDRGLPDQAAFSWYKGKEISPQLNVALGENRYAKKVFLTPPWPQIFQNDQIRTETYEEAERIHQFIVKAYLNYGYELIELPFVSPDERIEFILKLL